MKKKNLLSFCFASLGLVSLCLINHNQVKAAEADGQADVQTQNTSLDSQNPVINENKNNTTQQVTNPTNNERPYNAVATIKYQGPGKVAVWSNYNETKKLTGNYLANGTRWKTFKQAKDTNGSQWYNLGGNQWVIDKYITFSNAPTKKAAVTAQTNTRNGIAYEGQHKRYVFYRNDKIQTGKIVSGSQTFYTDKFSGIYSVQKNVPVISQRPELPTGCEMTAVTMMLQGAGVKVNKFQVARDTPRSSNGDYGFVGNPYSVTGWWVFPNGIAPVVRKYLGHSENLTGASLDRINDKLMHGHTVVMWMANMNGFVNHAITLTGYNNRGLYYYNNPWTGRRETMSKASLLSHWTKDRKRALSY